MWYVIQTSAGNEDIASEKCQIILEEGSFREIFVPQYVCMKKYQGTWHDQRLQSAANFVCEYREAGIWEER